MGRLQLRDRNFLLFCSAIIFLVFFRGLYALKVYSVVGGDDACYYRRLYDLFQEPTPFCEGIINVYAPGAALSWLPAAILAKLLSLIGIASFDQTVAVLGGLLSFGYWTGSTLMIHALLLRHASTRTCSAFFHFACVLAVPVLFYATNRASMAHAPEFFWVSLTFYLLSTGRRRWALLTGGVATLTRYHDIFIFCPILLSFLDVQGFQNRKKIWIVAAALVGVGCAVLATLLMIPYQGILMGSFIRWVGLDRWFWVLFATDWGLLWTAPLWLGGLFLGAFHFRTLSWTARGGWLWMASHLYLIVVWGGAGSEFAYRYLIGTYLPCILIWAEVLAKRPVLKKPFRVLVVASAIWISILTWLFKTTPQTTLMVTERNWNNEVLQIETLKALFNPVTLARPFGLSPPSAITYSWFLPERFSKYVLSGPMLWILTLATLGVLAFVGWFLLRDRPALRRGFRRGL